LFSKRKSQIQDVLLAAGIDPEHASLTQAKTASATTREHKPCGVDSEELRASWAHQAYEAGFALGDQAAAARGPRGLHGHPTVETIAAQVFDRETGVCAHTKKASRAAVFAAVCDALPCGVADLADAEALTSAVLSLDGGPAVPVPGQFAHLTHPDRYTTRDILTAEITALQVTRATYGADAAQIPPRITDLAVTAYENAKVFRLSTEQRAVVKRLTTAGHGVDAVIGVPTHGRYRPGDQLLAFLQNL
jgi:hypothetical protein